MTKSWGFCWSRKPEHILNRFGTRAAKYLIALFWHEESVSLARPAAFWPHTWSTCTYWFNLISRHGIDPYARSPTSIQTRQNQTPRDGEREFWQSPSLIIQNWGENLVRNEIMLRSIRTNLTAINGVDECNQSITSISYDQGPLGHFHYPP